MVMDLRLVEEGNWTMKIVGKESVVAAVFAGRSKRMICFMFAQGNVRKPVGSISRLLSVRSAGESADNPNSDISPS
jgi:hypothetical protein